MVKWQSTLVLIAAVILVLLIAVGRKLGNQTDESVAGWIKLVLLPGTYAALVFPGVHANGFIPAVVVFNLLLYETPVFLILFMIRRQRGKRSVSE